MDVFQVSTNFLAEHILWVFLIHSFIHFPTDWLFADSVAVNIYINFLCITNIYMEEMEWNYWVKMMQTFRIMRPLARILCKEHLFALLPLTSGHL